MSLCSHLEDYRVQFAATEAAYRQCVQLVESVLAEGPGSGRADLVVRAIGDWRLQDDRLRALLLELVKAGRVRVPRRLIAPGHHRHGAGSQGSIICAACRRAVPRLKYAEWQFAHNGTVTFRGHEFSPPQPASRP